MYRIKLADGYVESIELTTDGVFIYITDEGIWFDHKGPAEGVCKMINASEYSTIRAEVEG